MKKPHITRHKFHNGYRWIVVQRVPAFDLLGIKDRIHQTNMLAARFADRMNHMAASSPTHLT